METTQLIAELQTQIATIDGDLARLTVKRKALAEAAEALLDAFLPPTTAGTPTRTPPAASAVRQARPPVAAPADDWSAALLQALEASATPLKSSEIQRRAKLSHLSAPTILARLRDLMRAKRVIREGKGAKTTYRAA
ncbi:MAG: hypothetical protein AB7Q16_22975 [Vicinamibacterales bacterium]